MDPIMIAVLSVGGGLALIGAIYGALRRFSRLTWIGWQVLIAFGLDILVSFLPETMPFAVWIVLFVAIVALPLIGEYFLRKALVTDRILPPGKGEMIFDRIFGAVTAIVGILMFFAAVGGLGLSVVDAIPMQDGVSPLANVPIWTNFFSKYALDLFLISLFMIVMRAGCRLGVFRGLYLVLMLLLVAGAFFGSFLLFSKVSWAASFSGTVGGWFGLHGPLASFTGCVTLTFLVSAILFVGLMFLSKLLDSSIQKLNTHRAVAIPDALVLGAVFSVVFVAAVIGVQTAFGMLAKGDMLSGIVSELTSNFDLGEMEESIANIETTIADIGRNLANFATSSPISRGLYVGNPFIA